jgi:hypothetical protein
MTEIGSRFVKVGVETERAAQAAAGRDLVAHPVKGVSHRRHGVRRIGAGGREPSEYLIRPREETFSVKRPAHGQHQFDVVLVSQRLHLSKQLDTLPGTTEAKEDLAHPDQRVFVSGVQNQCALEGESRPCEFFPGQARMTEPDAEVHRVRI